MNLKKFQTLLLVIVGVLGAFYAAAVPFIRYKPDLSAEIKGSLAVLPVEPDTRPVLHSDVKPFETAAEAAIAYDLESQTVLFEKNPKEPWPTASLAKMMTALVTLNLRSFEDVITVQESDTEISNPRMGLVAGEQITIRSLLSGMLISSANDAAYALARGTTGSRAQFIGLMNALAQELNLKETQFSDPAGFDEINQHSTAADILSLAQEFLKHVELAKIVGTRSLKVTSADGSRSHWLTTTNKLLENGEALGVKTGYTDLAQGNLVSLFEDEEGHKVLTVVLGSSAREADSESLKSWIFSSYKFAKRS